MESPDSTTNAEGEILDRYREIKVASCDREEYVKCDSSIHPRDDEVHDNEIQHWDEELLDKKNGKVYFVCEKHYPNKKYFGRLLDLVYHCKQCHRHRCAQCNTLFFTTSARSRHISQDHIRT